MTEKQIRVLNQINDYTKIIKNLYKCSNSKIEIQYAGDLAKKIEECVNFIKAEEKTIK